MEIKDQTNLISDQEPIADQETTANETDSLQVSIPDIADIGTDARCDSTSDAETITITPADEPIQLDAGGNADRIVEMVSIKAEAVELKAEEDGTINEIPLLYDTDTHDVDELLSSVPVHNEFEELPVAQSEPEIIPEVDSDHHEADIVGEQMISANESIESMSRQELVSLLEQTVQDSDIQAIKNKVALIKVAFLNKDRESKHNEFEAYKISGGDPNTWKPSPDSVSEKFDHVFEIYRLHKQRYDEDQEKQKYTNLQEKKKILEELKQLISSEETLKRTYDEFRLLQERWRQVGVVPKAENNALWQNYHFLVEKFFDKVKINKELKDLDLRKNLERKIELCEKAEELLLETSIIKSFKQLQKYHEEWKEIGLAPSDKNEEIWERFKTASDKINERRREYYSNVQEEQDRNHLAKITLCDKAEQLIASNPQALKHWQQLNQEFVTLVKIWKTIGPAPKKFNNEIWARFRNNLDIHYKGYRDFLELLKEQQTNNYNLKLDLCVQAESLVQSTDWRNTTNELMRLQDQWKLIGPVPRKHSDKIWRRFRNACDVFFKRRSEHFANANKVEEENLKLKEDLIKQVEEIVLTGSRNQNLEQLKEFQRRWMEVGFVPMRDKERLQNSFRNAINKHLDRLKINAAEITAMEYRSRIESIKGAPDANRQLYRERAQLQLKISQLQEEVKLWENNIGFLAESKNASIYKTEFLKKIENAKQEMALLEVKLRYLRGA